MNTATEHVDSLDGWRGLAIVLLLGGHFFPIPGINLGSVGVNFFFVLSGWLMTRLLFVQNMPIDRFYRRRISRIVPAHVAFIALVTATWALIGGDVSLPETLSALFFLNNYVNPSPTGHLVMPFGHIWSLAVEEQSYVLLSLLAVAVRARWLSAKAALGGATLVCVVCAFVYAQYFASPTLAFDRWLHTEVSGYGIFVSGFLLLALPQRVLRKAPAFAVPLLLMCGLALHWWSVPPALQKVLGVGTLALAVNLLPQAPAALQAVLAWKPLRYLGLWSFSLYIWQQPFYLWSGGGGDKRPGWLGLLLAFAAGLASYYLLEQPARRYLNRTWGRPEAALRAQTR